jgi:hypothetical protein
MARGLRQSANEPELEFVPEQEQDSEFVPLTQEEAGNLTKAEYLASGGKPEDVISPEREAVLQQETQRQLQAGATPQQASIEAGKALDAMGTIRRPDGTIAEGYKPTAQALAEGIIETPAIPAVKEAQRLGIETVSSGTDKNTGFGFAIGRNKEGKVVRFEADKDGNVDSFELEPEEPSRLGAIARTVASQVIPSTTGAAAAEAAAALTPGGILPKLVTGAIAGVGGYIAGQKGQEAVAKALIPPEQVARISGMLQRDIEKYPVSTTIASILTPTVGGISTLGRRALGALAPQAESAVGAVAPAIAPAVETAIPKAVEAVAPKVEQAVERAGVAPLELPIELPTLTKERGYRQAGVKMVKDPFLDRGVREELAKSEDITYAKFGQKALQDALANESDDVVRGIFESGTAPQKVVANAELINRASKQNDVKSLLALAKTRIKLPTEAAQTVAAMRTLRSATPEGYLATLSVFLDKNGRTLTEPLLVKARNLFNLQAESRLKYETLAARARDTLNDFDIQKAIKAEKEFIGSAFNFQNFETRLVPKKFFAETLPTVIQGNLLAPLSLVTNLWSNAVSSLPRAMGRQGAFISQEVARAFKKSIGSPVVERTVSSPISLAGVRRVSETVKAFVRGGGEGLVGLKRGISAEGLLSGETIRGFQPIQAFKQFWSGSGLAQPVLNGWKGLGQAGLDRARLAAETVLGVPPETMLRLLQLGDTPFRRMAQARLLSESTQLQRTSKLSSLNEKLSGLLSKTKTSKVDSIKIQDIRNKIEGIAKRNLSKEISVATRFPSAEELGKIEQEAAEAVFQQDTPLSRAALSVSNMFGLGNRVGLARTIGKTIIPYAKTPANVIDEMLDYSLPGYAFITKGIPAMQAKNARGVHIAIGKTLTSLTIGAVAKTLSDAGVIGGSAEDSEKTRDVQYKTLPPRTINVSALQRFAEGDSTELQPGDSVMNLEKMGIVGGMLATWNEASKATEGRDFISPEFLTALVPETLSFAMNQSFLKGTNSLLSAMLDGKRDKMDKWIASYFGTVSSIVLPNTLNAVSRAMSDSLPEKIKIKDIEGENVVDRTLNLFNEVIKRKLPGYGDDLPRKIDIWGREIPQTPEGADPVMYNFFDFTKSRDATYDQITLGIYKLFKETENGDAIPPKPLEQFMIKNEKYRLSPELYEKYSKIRGRANRAAAEALFGDSRFKRLGSEEKVKSLKNAYSQVGDDARKEFLIRNEFAIKRGQKQ